MQTREFESSSRYSGRSEESSPKLYEHFSPIRPRKMRDSNVSGAEKLYSPKVRSFNAPRNDILPKKKTLSVIQFNAESLALPKLNQLKSRFLDLASTQNLNEPPSHR